MRKSSLLLMLLITTPVWACETYEECISTAERLAPGTTFQSQNNTIKSEIMTKDEMYLKAIAIKLDEISKKLDQPNQADINALKEIYCHENPPGLNWSDKANKRHWEVCGDGRPWEEVK